MEINKGKEVMEYLRPNGGWVIYGHDFDSIKYFDCEEVSRKEFEDTLSNIDSIVEFKKNEQSNAKKSLLEKLGINEDEAKLLLS